MGGTRSNILRLPGDAPQLLRPHGRPGIALHLATLVTLENRIGSLTAFWTNYTHFYDSFRGGEPGGTW